ncbi:DUF421 domain-containing protein [Fodinibius sp. Rm-B-1B1-1]|uniref:DUF421 domain-containing protein n=1 Tax=Fodinibius alkaliphilus TaxID=3140241 RepID=UPI00315B321D
MDLSWILTTRDALLMVVISTVGIYIALIVFTRLGGLRSFSKMSSFDFAITVAIGSIVATSLLSSDPPLLQAVTALGVLYVVQMTVARLRVKNIGIGKMVDNKPILLMDKSKILDGNLDKAGVTISDLRAKLREANVTQLSQVKAVVMESTGDISVLHHSDPDHELDSILLKDVTGG